MSDPSTRGLVSLTAKVLPCERDFARARARDAGKSLSDWVAEACRKHGVAEDLERIEKQMLSRKALMIHPGSGIAPLPATYSDAIEEIALLRSQLIRERKQLAEMVERSELAKRGAP